MNYAITEFKNATKGMKYSKRGFIIGSQCFIQTFPQYLVFTFIFHKYKFFIRALYVDSKFDDLVILIIKEKEKLLHMGLIKIFEHQASMEIIPKEKKENAKI